MEKRPGLWSVVQDRSIISHIIEPLANLFVEFKSKWTRNYKQVHGETSGLIRQERTRVLLHIANGPPKQSRTLGSHPNYEKHFSHSDTLIILSTLSCFQFHLLLPARSFSLKLGPIIKLWASVSLQTHAYSFSTACQKTFGPQESFVRTHTESCNSFIAGYHLQFNSFKAFTGMSINLSIWIQINQFFGVCIFSRVSS